MTFKNVCQVGDVTITLAWDDRNDLDLHVHVLPHGKTTSTEIFYGNRHAEGGYLDVVRVHCVRAAATASKQRCSVARTTCGYSCVAPLSVASRLQQGAKDLAMHFVSFVLPCTTS